MIGAPPLIAVVPPEVPVRPGLLDVPGGFVWWYLDLLDARGDGIVVIWSFGLPFLPGAGSAARRGRGELPRRRPSLNVAVYERSTPVFYLLQELAPEEAGWDGEGAWRFGESRLESRAGSGRAALSIALSCPLPGGGRLEGGVDVQGARCGGLGREAAGIVGGEGAPHGWSPLLAPGEGEARLHLGGKRRFSVHGRAYHDRNASTVPLDALGIEEWFWARWSLPNEERVLYVLEGGGGEEALALSLGRDGCACCHRADVTLERVGAGRFGMPRYGRVSARVDGEPFLDARVGRALDDGPFYRRSFLEGARDSATQGYCEVVAPPRVDLERHRPLVRMRVHQTCARNSPFVPLFSGHRRGRLVRFARHLMGGARG